MVTPTPEQLDKVWNDALCSDSPPDIVVSLEARFQRAVEAVEKAQGELRDWARMEMAKARGF